MNVEIDTTARALYLRLASGTVANTVVLTDGAIADHDESGAILGIEVIHAEDLLAVLSDDLSPAQLSSRLSYLALDVGKSWEVEAGAEAFNPGVDAHRLIAELNAEFVSEILANRVLLDRIPEGATLVIFRPGDANISPMDVLGIAEQLSREGKLAVLQPLGIPAPEHDQWVMPHLPHFVVKTLSPQWPPEIATTPPDLTYYLDTDTLVWTFMAGQTFEQESQRLAPIRHPAYGLLAVDLDTQYVVANLFPGFRFYFLERFREMRVWMAVANLRWTTPMVIRNLLEDIAPDPEGRGIDPEGARERLAGFG